MLLIWNRRTPWSHTRPCSSLPAIQTHPLSWIKLMPPSRIKFSRANTVVEKLMVSKPSCVMGVKRCTIYHAFSPQSNQSRPVVGTAWSAALIVYSSSPAMWTHLQNQIKLRPPAYTKFCRANSVAKKLMAIGGLFVMDAKQCTISHASNRLSNQSRLGVGTAPPVVLFRRNRPNLIKTACMRIVWFVIALRSPKLWKPMRMEA